MIALAISEETREALLDRRLWNDAYDTLLELAEKYSKTDISEKLYDAVLDASSEMTAQLCELIDGDLEELNPDL